MKSFLNRAKLARSYFKKSPISDGMPAQLSIELTSRCNLVCVMCPRDDKAKRGLGNMKEETFRKIIDEASRYTEFSWLHLAGESLLHPQFGQFIDYAASKGIDTGISTNGTVLDERATDTLLNSKLKNLILSVDATSPEVYKAVRGVDCFHKVVRNSENFLKRKSEVKKGPFTIVQMIILKENERQAPEFKKRWEDLGADAVYIKEMINFAGTVKEDHAPAADKYNERYLPTDPNRPPCFLLWRQIAFYYDGTAISCCADFLHQSELGNIHKQSLAEIWNGPVLTEMRRKHIEGRQSEIPLCAGCDQPKLDNRRVLGATLVNATVLERSIPPFLDLLREFGEKAASKLRRSPKKSA